MSASIVIPGKCLLPKARLEHWQPPKDADGQPFPHLTATDLLPWARIQLADARYRWTEAQRIGVADTMQRHEVHRWESLVCVLSQNATP